MNLTKREFMQVMGAGSMAGLNMNAYAQADSQVAAHGLYDIPKFGQVSFLHMTDCHAQLKPIYFLSLIHI
jgi:sulfur-oxidizing protein SoxB